MLPWILSFGRSEDAIQAHGPAGALQSEKPAISGNPGAVDFMVGNGFLQSLTPLKPRAGVSFGGIWLGDYNIVMSGGAQPGMSSWNSLLIVSALVDASELVGWKGADFGIQFLQFNGQNTNGQAGSVQGYNGLQGVPPLARSELYQLWFRLALFDDRLIFRIGRSVPTYDFNNVLRPVTVDRKSLQIPAVSGLLYAPIFVNPTMLGALPGYYNSADGLTVTFAPVRNAYLSYGFYDGNLANGTQTGLVGPQFNGYFFQILEAGLDWVIRGEYPGQIGAGLWCQTGPLQGQSGLSENGAGGFYLFGSQRIWGNSGNKDALAVGTDKKSKLVTLAGEQDSSISLFYQFGINSSETLPVNQYFGVGFTGFGLVRGRPGDSFGGGLAWSWLNSNVFDRPSELMFQGYYQAHLHGGAYFQPTVTCIPTPGGSGSLGGAWALTLRVTLLF